MYADIALRITCGRVEWGDSVGIMDVDAGVDVYLTPRRGSGSLCLGRENGK